MWTVRQTRDVSTIPGILHTHPPILMLPACCLLGDIPLPALGPLARSEQEWDTCFPTTTQLLPPHRFPSSLLPFPKLAQNTQGPVITQCRPS